MDRNPVENNKSENLKFKEWIRLRTNNVWFNEVNTVHFIL